MKNKKIGVLVLFGLLLAGCATHVPDEMRAVMLGQEDIPSSWIIFNESTGEEWGGDMYNIGFAYGNESTAAAIEQQLIVYADADAAVKGFGEYKDYIYTDKWSTPAEADFSPMTSSDLYEFKCADQELDHVLLKNCLVLQQHDNYVSAVGASVSGPLTFEALNAALKSIDKKMNGN
jgi:hypothetical protein